MGVCSPSFAFHRIRAVRRCGAAAAWGHAQDLQLLLSRLTLLLEHLLSVVCSWPQAGEDLQAAWDQFAKGLNTWSGVSLQDCRTAKAHLSRTRLSPNHPAAKHSGSRAGAPLPSRCCCFCCLQKCGLIRFSKSRRNCNCIYFCRKKRLVSFHIQAERVISG